MKLKDVKFGIGHTYFETQLEQRCYVVNCDFDDGARLIVETFEDGDLSGKLYSTEACYLESKT